MLPFWVATALPGAVAPGYSTAAVLKPAAAASIAIKNMTTLDDLMGFKECILELYWGLIEG